MTSDDLPPPPPTPPLPLGYLPPYLPYSSNVVMPYESARPLSKVVVGLLWATVAMQLMLVLPYVAEISNLNAARASGEVAGDALSPAVIAIVAIGMVYLVVYIVLVVFWMMWVHRTYQNLPSLGAQGLTYSPAWAVGYWFIPILNLFRPYQVMRETWRASHPGHAGGTQWTLVAVPAVLGWWWALHVTVFIAGNFSGVGNVSEDPDVLYGIAWLDLLLLVVGVSLALVEIWIVKTLTQMQDDRASGATAWQAAPAPPVSVAQEAAGQ